jgi:hypothetical protein
MHDGRDDRIVTDEQLRLLMERDNPTADLARYVLERRDDGDDVTPSVDGYQGLSVAGD